MTFPAIHQCGDTQIAWTDSDPTSDRPAPTAVATEAIATPHTAAPNSGADLGQVLTGILALTIALAAAGATVAGRPRTR